MIKYQGYVWPHNGEPCTGKYLKPGMILKTDIRDMNGHLLLGADTELTERHLYVFRTWGVLEVDIKDVTEEEVEALVTENIDPEALRKAEADLAEIFRHAEQDHPFMKELFLFCSLRRVRLASDDNV